MMVQEVGVSVSRFVSSRNGNFVQMEGYFPFQPVGTEKSGVPLKVVCLFQKISICNARSICISTGWTGNYGQMESVPGSRETTWSKVSRLRKQHYAGRDQVRTMDSLIFH